LANGHSNVKISGGAFGGAGFMSGYVAVGDFFTSADEWEGNPQIVIEGGDFGGTGTFAGIIHEAKPTGAIVIKGSGFNFPFGPVETAATNPFAGPPTQLLGTLSNGDAIDTSIYKENGEDAIIELVED
jgi:hypothetical protein